MTRVKFSSPWQGHHVGDVVDLDDDEARRLINAGYAQSVDATTPIVSGPRSVMADFSTLADGEILAWNGTAFMAEGVDPATLGGGTGGTGGPETDPVATAALQTHESGADPHGDRAAAATDAASKVAAHTGAADPHGDRAYTDTQVGLLRGTSPAALDTLAEIDAQLASDETGAAAMLASINQNTTNLGDHLADPTDAHDASAVSVNPSGLIVVTSTDVQAALAQLDARVNANTQGLKYVPDLIGNRPTPAAFGVGLFWATDDDGGTLWRSDGVSWQQITVGLNWASGVQLAYSEDTALNFNVKAVGTTQTDVSATMRVTVPASSVPVAIEAKVFGSSATGTSVSGSFSQMVMALTDNANTVLDFDIFPVVQPPAATTQTFFHSFFVRIPLPAPFAGGTYKLRAYLLQAAPTNWGAISLFSGGAWPKAWIRAVAS